MLARRFRPFAAALSLAACAHGPRAGQSPAGTSAAPAPIHPAAAVTSDDDFDRRRAEYDALDEADPRRLAERAALEAFAIEEARRELERSHAEAALEQLKQAASLWQPSDLATGRPQPTDPVAPQLAKLARDVEAVFAKRGTHGAALLALAVERALAPSDTAAERRWQTIVDWLEAEGGGDRQEGDGRRALIEDLEGAASVWPAPLVAESLARLYATTDATPPRSIRRRFGGGDFGELFGQVSAPSPAFKLAALWLRLSRPDEALAAVEKLDGLRGDAKMRRALEKYTAKGAGPDDVRDLAKLIAESSTLYLVAERVCRDATQRFPTASGPWLCVGEIAGQLGQLPVAVRAFEEAISREPGRWEAWEALAKLYHVRLFQLASDEHPTGLEATVARVERLYGDARTRFPDRALRPGIASAFFEVARGHYNAGRIDESVAQCEHSLTIEPTVAAHEQLGQIALKRGDARRAIAEYTKAIALAEEREPAGRAASSSDGDRDYWRAKLHHGLGDALDLDGNDGEAQAAWHRSVVAWEALLRASGGPAAGRMSPEEISEGELDRGKVLWALGDRDRGIAALQRAIDVAPDRAPTYADALAFLVERGEREEALDVYHRALGRAEVSEYLKVYCTLWMMDLDRRAHAPEDPLGRAFLAGVDGAKWYQELARWATGRETDGELTAHADTPARRAEAEFYRAMRAWESGGTDEARAGWRRVLDTRMMAFFEFDMASYYLRHGAPSEPVRRKPAAAQQGAAPSTQRVPDGSI